MAIRDRIKEFRRVKASELRPNPGNWRTHPPAQQAALRGVLEEIGYADALLARELADGTLELIDGHLRAEITPDAVVPVLILDVNQEEAEKILLTHDPLAAMAEADEGPLADLLQRVETQSADLKTMLDDLARQSGVDLPLESEAAVPPGVVIPDSYQVVVECRDEQDQRDIYTRMTEEGYRCRVLTL